MTGSTVDGSAVYATVGAAGVGLVTASPLNCNMVSLTSASAARRPVWNQRRRLAETALPKRAKLGVLGEGVCLPFPLERALHDGSRGARDILPGRVP